MSEQQTQSPRFTERHYFLVRRLHSLTGLVPIGVFLCFHLLANSTIIVPGSRGADYQKAIERIHELKPFLIPIEFAFIFVPLLFHAMLGFAIWFTARPNALQYSHLPNVRYTWQRFTGGIAFAFVVYHVIQMHWLGEPLGGGHFALHDETGGPAAAVTTAKAIQAAWWIAPVYAVGVVACVYHLANGIWTSLITWGITIRPRSQQVAGYFCAALGVVLSLIGLGGLAGFRTFDVDSAASRTTVAATNDTGPEH